MDISLLLVLICQMTAIVRRALVEVCTVRVLLVVVIGSRPSDHYFRSVCLFVCAEFFSAVFDPISIKVGHMLYVWV